MKEYIAGLSGAKVILQGHDSSHPPKGGGSSLPLDPQRYKDEGHGFARPENRLSFYAITEAFPREHLGGSYQPICQDFAGANLTVPADSNQVPGLEEALRAFLNKG